MIHQWRMRGRLQSLTDGELSSAARVALARHLAGCPACAAAVRRLRETDGLLTRVCPTPPPLPTAVAHAMLDRALAESGRFPGGPGRGWPRLAWGLAAGLLVAAGSAAAWWGIGTPRTPRVAEGLTSPPSAVATAGRYSRGEEGPQTTGLRHPRRPQSAPRKRSPADSPSEPRSTPEKPKRPRKEPSARPAPPARPGTGSGARPRRARPPRYRLVRGDTPLRGEVRSAAWWDRLTGEVEASEAAAGALQDELWLSERLACLVREQPSEGDPVTEAVLWAPEEGEPAGDLQFGQDPGVSIPGEPLADDRGVVEHGSTPDPTLDLPLGLRDDPIAAPPAPQLLVIATGAPEPSGITVTHCSEATPGFARAIALRPDGCGGATWTQATVTSEEEGPKLALVMLGSNAHWWE